MATYDDMIAQALRRKQVAIDWRDLYPPDSKGHREAQLEIQLIDMRLTLLDALKPFLEWFDTHPAPKENKQGPGITPALRPAVETPGGACDALRSGGLPRHHRTSTSAQAD